MSEPTRRDFLRRSTQAAAGAALAPLVPVAEVVAATAVVAPTIVGPALFCGCLIFVDGECSESQIMVADDGRWVWKDGEVWRDLNVEAEEYITEASHRAANA